MPFAFSTSALFLPDLCSILRPKCEAQDRAMLHAAIINFRRRIVNRTRGFSCRAAAQFNPGLEVLRWGYGGGTEGRWRGDGQILEDANPKCSFLTTWLPWPWSGFEVALGSQSVG